MDTSASTADDKPFAGLKLQKVDKVSVNMPMDNWLCKKMDKLNVTLVDGYPSCSSKASGLPKDQFVKPARSQTKWYGLHTNKEISSSSVTYWYSEASKLNSCYSSIAKASEISSTSLALRKISQKTLRKWEKSNHESIYICNQTARFNRCLNKVQESMQKQF